MTELAVAIFSVLAAVAPVIVLSKPRRMLRHIRDEAATLEALPNDHPSRKVLSKRLKQSVKRYNSYVADTRARQALITALVFYGLAMAALVGTYIIQSTVFKSSDDGPLFGKEFWIITQSVVLLLAVVWFVQSASNILRFSRLITRKVKSDRALRLREEMPTSIAQMLNPVRMLRVAKVARQMSRELDKEEDEALRARSQKARQVDG